MNSITKYEVSKHLIKYYYFFFLDDAVVESIFLFFGVDLLLIFATENKKTELKN